MTYKTAIKEALHEYAFTHFEDIRFVGYNTALASRMYGSLEDIIRSRCIESPVCENLMMGMAVGMAMVGMRPVVCFERHDFLLLGLDALVNHADKLPFMSGDQYKLPIVVRAIVGAKEPLNPGPQHTMDYTNALKEMLKYTPVYEPKSLDEFKAAYKMCGKSESGVVVIVEHRSLYDTQI